MSLGSPPESTPYLVAGWLLRIKPQCFCRPTLTVDLYHKKYWCQFLGHLLFSAEELVVWEHGLVSGATMQGIRVGVETLHLIEDHTCWDS